MTDTATLQLDVTKIRVGTLQGDVGRGIPSPILQLEIQLITCQMDANTHRGACCIARGCLTRPPQAPRTEQLLLPASASPVISQVLRLRWPALS